MKNKMKFLIQQSLNKKIKTKWFKVVNVILLCLLIFLVNIDSVISLFGGDFEETITVYVEDEVGAFPLFKESFESISSTLQPNQKYLLEQKEKIEDEKENLKENPNELLMILSKGKTGEIEGEIISYDEVGMMTEQVLTSALSTVKETMAIQESGLTMEEIEKITSPPNITFTTMNENSTESENKDLVATGVSFVIILPCFFLILMLVQMIGAEVNDEKTTRSMEIIISNVSPKVHFLSKIISSTLFVGIQGLLLLLYGAIALGSRWIFTGSSFVNADTIGSVSSLLNTVKSSGLIDVLLQGLPLLIILFLSSFLLYAIVAGVLASMTTSLEDFQQLQTPMMLMIMIGYYLALMATQFEGAFFIKFAAFIPMISFLLAPVLFLLGELSILELAISTILIVLFTWIVFHYGLRIYKVGILNYSSQKLWKKMFQSIKKKS